MTFHLITNLLRHNRMKHFDILEKNLEPTSVLIPCEGCALNMEKNNNNLCVIRVKTRDLHKALNIIDDHIINDIEEESTVTSNTAGSSNHRNEEIVGCNILEDISLNIKKWISGYKGKLIELTMIKDKLKLRNHIKVYTDGSLLNRLCEDIMGFGWVIPEIQDYEQLTFRDNIREFPSSTRAELMAILTCLLEMLDKATVNIYTDSMCALQNMNIIKNKSGKRIWKHCKNPVILQIISEIIKEKDLKVNCYKVKAHSGDKFNEIADALAQIPPSLCGFYNDRFEGTTITLNYKNIKNRNFISMWNSSLLEIPIKEAAKEIHRLIGILLLKQNIQLPTMTKRHLHQPNLYEDSECIFCSHAEEDNLHVFTCKRGGEEDPIRELHVKFKVILRKKIIQNKPNIEDSTIKNRLNMITCLNYCGEVDYHSTKHGPYLTFFEIIKGFVPDLLTYKVTEICKDKRMTVRVIMETFEDFQNVLKEIWKDRCEKVITWEIENGITNKA
ncbi:hypothetical protein Glove_164g18 [Diversispora epigaea]|uniref:RNase H type-1 domain-containing protein n=1 Tax=Diversispora epigaea TaxID=1348612 RepID=A0A397J0K0_9GLOM|nr:hypothetical protein Glove_164g18 [Diversispora epigaea]